MSRTLKIKPADSRRKVFIVKARRGEPAPLAQMINAEEDLIVCGEAMATHRTVSAIARIKPDVVLMDILLRGASGLELIKELRSVNGQVRILVVSSHYTPNYPNRVLQAGGDGYVTKRDALEEIVYAIRDVLEGHIYVSDELLDSPPGTAGKRSSKSQTSLPDRLSEVDRTILKLLGQGKDNREIARRLKLTIGKVIVRCTQMKQQMKLKSDNALVRYAVLQSERDRL